MNWELFDRWRATIYSLQPRQYSHVRPIISDGCGCASAWLERISGDRRGSEHVLSYMSRVIGITYLEAQHIFGWVDRITDPGYDPNRPYGKAEALRRLDLVASRYTRPTISTDSSDFKARERAFLQSCKAVAAQPVEVE